MALTLLKHEGQISVAVPDMPGWFLPAYPTDSAWLTSMGIDPAEFAELIAPVQTREGMTEAEYESVWTRRDALPEA